MSFFISGKNPDASPDFVIAVGKTWVGIDEPYPTGLSPLVVLLSSSVLLILPYVIR